MQEDNLLIGAIDQGTSSSRFLVLNLNFEFGVYFLLNQLFKVFSAQDFQLITYHQVPIKLISNQAG